MNEDKASRFHRLRRQAVVLTAAWTVVLLLGLVLTGTSARFAASLRGTLAALVPSPLVTPLAAACCAVIIAAIHELVAFPFAFFTGFVLERRFGLSRQRFSEWVVDQVKALSIGFVLLGTGAGVVYAAIAIWPERWWIAAALVAIGVSVLIAWAAPVVLLPLFFKATPLKNPGLRDRLAGMAARAGAPITDVYEWRLSDRTSRANAALTGFGRTRRILLSDTLLAEYSDDEIEVVLAHEISHHVHHDVWLALVLEALVATAALWLASRILPACAAWLGLAGAADVAGLPLLALILLGVSFVVLPLANAVSRAQEWRADAFALRTTGKADVFVSAMRRLAARNLAEEDPPLWARIFFYTHPPFADRIARAKRWGSRGR